VGKRKRIEEILKMSKEELFQYIKQEDSSIQSTDKIEMKPFEHGIKIFYFENKDVVRHPLVQKIIEAYEKFINQS
jgi:phosphate starvation-inducible protein PhoH